MARGGKRPGAGRPKGSKNRPDAPSELAKVDKELLREQLRAKVRAHLGPMVDAQIASASGIKYLVARHKDSGKFVELTEVMAKAIISGNDKDHFLLEVWEKQPSTQAFTDLMNRTIDKPAETVQADFKGDLTFRWESD